jgi:hypothetical protein
MDVLLTDLVAHLQDGSSRYYRQNAGLFFFGFYFSLINLINTYPFNSIIQ